MATLIPPPPPPPPPPAAAADPKVDYLNLPCPIPFEELHREAMMSLKPDLFEGMRFDFTKMLNQKFSLNHSVLMGPTEVPSQSTETIKIPTAHYEFGSTFIDHPRLLLWGRILTDGRLNARVKCDLSENLTFKANAQYVVYGVPLSLPIPMLVFCCASLASFTHHNSFSCLLVQLTNEPHMSHAMINFDYKSVTQHLSLGGEVFWAGQHRKSGIGYAARYNTDKSVATGQVASTGMVLLSYVQKVSEKVSLASEFMCNYLSRDVTASFGYDYILRQCRLRGKIDSNGCVAAFLEERLNMGLNFILSAELDHRKKDYKFGFGLTVGE
ncbi:hypothetical protein JHK85_020931 [Glycine max]|nr:hypothetical protein JHK85_020931 [Glycine max]